jgi:hypothetical protein
MEWWQGLTSGTTNRHITRISKKRTVARIRCSRGGRKASATGVKVAGLGTSNIKAKEFDSPLAWGAGVVGGSIPTARAAAAEGVIGAWEEADKSSRASSAGNQGFATSLYGVWDGSHMAMFGCSVLDITGVYKFIFPLPRNPSRRSLIRGHDINLVNKSEMLVSPSSWAIRKYPAAQASRVQWQQIAM